MKKKVFSVKKFILFVFLLCLIIGASLLGTYFYCLNYSYTGKEVSIEVVDGDSYATIGSKLKEKNLIKSELVYKIYIKLNTPNNLEKGIYYIKSGSKINDLIKIFESGAVDNRKTVDVTFVEGKNMRYVASVIKDKFGYKETEFMKKINDSEYLDSLIEKYWFLTDEIKNKDIYYSLEGYLYPDTYTFYEDASIENIIETMLDNMDKKLVNYKDSISKSKYTIHQMLTLASIVEQEAGNAADRKGVSGVFYNRLNDGWSLGSDVTTYYAEKIDNWLRDLKQSELNECNAYNTRSTCMAGKLPVSPICNPSLNSIISAIEPKKHNYYYFVADKNGKTYFNKTDYEHVSTVNRLKSEGLWIEYES